MSTRLALLGVLVLTGCAVHDPPRYLPATVNAPSWIDLVGQTQLRIDNAYFRPNTVERNLTNYLGTETARYRVTDRGDLRLLSVEHTAQRPAGEAPVDGLLPVRQARYRYHRFYFAVKFSRRQQPQGAVLVSAASRAELLVLAERLANSPDEVCGGASPHCTVFPEMCTVSPQMEITVNGAERTVLWGSTAASVIRDTKNPSIERRQSGRYFNMTLPPEDPAGTKLVLLPGDRITFEVK